MRLNIQKKFGLKIRELRKSRKLSQEELAFKAKLHPTYISAIERGEYNLTIKNIKKLADCLKVKVFEVFKEIE